MSADKPERHDTRGKSAVLLARLGRGLPLMTLGICGMALLPTLLLLKGSLVSALTVPFVFLIAAVFYHRVSSVRILAEARQLKDDNAALVQSLSAEKLAAEQARDAAEAATRAKSVFIANISHEIRNPLNALLGMAQLLERSGLEPPQREYVKVMLEAGRGLRTLLDDVITLARADQASTDGDTCDVALAARAVGQLLQPRAWEKKLRLSVSAAPDLPHAAADPRRVRQVLLKLAENALKFTERGAVDVSVDQVRDKDGRDCLRFAVRDTGHGIPQEVAAHLFEPFALGDSSYARKHQGAGLGLSVARRVVAQLGGSIGFDSEPGMGATFWFVLPSVTERANPKTPFLDLAGDMPAPSDLRLLVFVRKAGLAQEIAAALEPFGNQLVQANDAAAAALAASREGFDAIIAEARDVEGLAAVPGRRVPLLALLLSGDRPPASGDAALHWPARPREFYGVLHRLTAREGSAQPRVAAPVAAPPIDAMAFAALEKSLGLPVLIEILQSYVVTAEQLCTALGRACADSNWDEAGRVAQDIAGAAGGLGLAAMTTAARGFAQATRQSADAHSLRNEAQIVMGEHARVRLALNSLYPDLAA